MVRAYGFYKHLHFSQAYPVGNLVFKLPVLSYFPEAACRDTSYYKMNQMNRLC